MDEKKRKKRLTLIVVWSILGIFFLSFGIFCNGQVDAPPENIIIPGIPNAVWRTLGIIFIVLSIPTFIMIPVTIVLAIAVAGKAAGKATIATAKAIAKSAEESKAKQEKEENERIPNGDGTYKPTIMEIRLALMGINKEYSQFDMHAKIKTSFDMSLDRSKVTVKADIYYSYGSDTTQDEFTEFSRNVYENVSSQIQYRLENDIMPGTSFKYVIKMNQHV